MIETLSSEGKDLMITGIGHSKEKDNTNASENLQRMDPSVMEVSGVALFKKDKLVQWLDGELARTAQLIVSEAKSTSFPLTCRNNREEKLITVTTRQNKTRLSTEVKNSKILLTINISLKGEISEATCHLDFTDPNTLKDLEDQLANEVRSQVMEVLNITQKHGTDVFGFGDKLSKTKPSYWKEHKQEWNELFSGALLTVKVEASIENTGMRVNPFNYK